MKRILLLMGFIFCFSTYFWAIGIQKIAGPTSVTINTKVKYEIRLDGPAPKAITFKTKITGGILSSGGGIANGAGFAYIEVFWNETRSDGKIEIMLDYPYGNQASLGGIVIKNSNNEEPLPAMSITGPESLYLLQPATYKLTGYNSTVKTVSWEDGKKSLYYKNTTGFETTVTAIKPSPIGVTGLIAVINNTFSRPNLVMKDIKIIEPSLTKNASIVCNDKTISYTLNNFYPKATITWQAGSNLTLVSGQGTASATFKGSGNGKGVIKATITYNGQSYSLENSDVWVGVPPVPQNIVGFQANSTDSREMLVIPGQSYSFSLPKENTATGGEWTVKSLSQIKIPYREWVNGEGVFVDIPNIQPSGMSYMINISAANKNNCGTSTPISRLLIWGGNDPRNRASAKTQSIESVQSELQPTSIRIYSYPTGSLVYQKKNVVNFDIQNTTLGEGIYILEITDQEGNVTREKVMKSKQ